MLGYADVLLEAPLDEESRLYISRIKEQAERAASLTQQLLAYSRKQLLQFRVVDLNALFLEMQDLLKRLIGEDIEMKVSLAPDLKRVRADTSQLEQVIMNLALNARDALPQGGSVIFETSNTDVEDDLPLSRELVPGPYVVLTVSDNGIGMDAETRAKIFEPFFTTKGLGKGTGLGLSTVYGIVKQSGGHISVYSEKGTGSTFRVFLPATAENEQVRIKQPSRSEVPRGSGSILITEDEEGVRKMMELVLSQAGYSVHSEGVPQQAVTYAGLQKAIDLLITDIILPGMNGRKLAEEILKAHPKTKVLFISGYTETAIGEHGIFAEGFAFLQKPFLPKTLRAKVDEILRG
jgi:two-component system cell cycle sensor histidine kinase/response regulator CckA